MAIKPTKGSNPKAHSNTVTMKMIVRIRPWFRADYPCDGKKFGIPKKKE